MIEGHFFHILGGHLIKFIGCDRIGYIDPLHGMKQLMADGTEQAVIGQSVSPSKISHGNDHVGVAEHRGLRRAIGAFIFSA